MSAKQELRIALSDANAKICELRKQNADLAEENLAAHLVNKEFADEVRELKKLSEERRVALLTALSKEEDIIKKEKPKESKHLSYADGRKHTVARIRAYINTKWDWVRLTKEDI
jgi:hypothetical protein